MALIMGVLHEDAKKRKAPSALQTISVSMIREWSFYGQIPELRIIGKDDHWYRVRPSGKLRMWKRDAHRVELPVKYGMYESITLTSADFDGGRVATVVSSNPPVGVIPGNLEKIFYDRVGATKHPGPYQHRFGRGAKMIAMQNGDIVIRSATGRRLWGRY